MIFPKHEGRIALSQQVADIDDPLAPQTSLFDYVKFKEFFLAPEISCPDLICSSETAILDVDSLASNITWSLTPSYIYSGATTGSGKTATINVTSLATGQYGKITYTFEMPSGENFEAEKSFWVGPPDEQYLDLTATMGGDDKLISGEQNQIVASYNGGPGTPLIDHDFYIIQNLQGFESLKVLL